MEHQQRKVPVSPEVALANDVFDQFCAASTFKSILGHHRHLCELLHIKPTNFPQFYPKLKAKLRSWKAQALWIKYDKRAAHKCYNRGKACPNTRVLIIGAGPCGLRAAIEAQLLGAKVVLVEKRDRISRNNVLHLWPFVIQDLRALGAKKFFGKFCAGAIDHISIRQLQFILLKVALIFGVEIHENLGFESLLPPSDDPSEERGWRAIVDPADHPVSQYEFDILIGADGKRNTLEGFKRKEFRGKLAIAITANFINRKTEAEARVEEISGVAFIFNQKFFKELYAATGIDLENIVYYKDETHYFVMTAKKHSLLDKGVILNDLADTARLLSVDNIDKAALMEYAREAADFSTGYKLPQLEFAVNHYGQPDVAMFDFTSMFAAENASRVLEKGGHRLLVTLVGDSLLEPFWPTGSGCARGFLSSMDACWAVRGWGMGRNPLDVLAERESVYRILGQTTPENLHRDYAAYTLDPHTRYPNLNSRLVLPIHVRGLYSSDNPEAIEQWLKCPPALDLPKKRRRKDSQVHPDTLLHWLKKQVMTGLEMEQCEVPDKLAMLSYLSQLYDTFRGEIPHIKHPKLEDDELPSKATTKEEDATAKLRSLTPAQRISLLGRIVSPPQPTAAHHRKRHSTLPRANADGQTSSAVSRRARKRRSAAASDRTTLQQVKEDYEDRQQVREEIERNRMERMMRRMYLRHLASQQFVKSMQMLQSNARSDGDNSPFEDYSLFVYRQTAPDFKDRVKELELKMNPLQAEREAKLLAEIKRGAPDEDFSGRIKNIEAKLKGGSILDKKPKDLLRAIGKIEKTDWNVREIEKKIEENKMGRGHKSRQEKVPKWSREQFDEKFSAVERKLKARSNEAGNHNKYSDIDKNLKRIEQKIRDGSVLEQGRNKVTAMAAQLAIKNQSEQEKPPLQKSNSKAALALVAQGGSEMCHFCNKRVYLMERLSAEGRFFHRGCFRCEYCSTTLRLGSYAFDRDGKFGSKFFCTYHFGLQGTQMMKASRKSEEHRRALGKENKPKTPETPKITKRDDFDLNRGETPERVEFENLSGGEEVEGGERVIVSEMDEDEWTDRNFGASAAEGSSDELSDLSESENDDDDDDDAEADFAEALTADEKFRLEETFRLAENWTRRHRTADDSDDSRRNFSYQEFDSEDDDDSDTATEGEDDIRAREMRKKEFEHHAPNSPGTDSGSDTEVASDEEYSESVSEEEDSEEEENEIENSATEIETDSEFEHDGSKQDVIIGDVPVKDIVHVKKGKLEEPMRVKVLTRPGTILNGNGSKEVNQKPADIQLKLRPLVPEEKENNIINNNLNHSAVPLVNPRKGDYLLNRTQSTEGIASKISLELKKRYLLGPVDLTGSVRKSGSASTLDSKLKNFVDHISEHQKLLNPAPEISPTMQAFLQGADKLKTSPTIGQTTQLFNSVKKEKELPRLADFGHVCSLKNNKEESVDLKNSVIEESSTNNVDDVSEKEKILNSLNQKESLESPPHILNEVDSRPRSPVHETSILVPDFPRRTEAKKNGDEEDEEEEEDDMESDSLSSEMTGSSSEEDEDVEKEEKKSQGVVLPPKVEIHNSRGELMDDDGEIVDQKVEEGSVETTGDSVNIICEVPDVVAVAAELDYNSMEECDRSKQIDLVPKMSVEAESNNTFNSKIITVPSSINSEGQILKQVSTPAELFVSDEGTGEDKLSRRSSPSSPVSLQCDDSEGYQNESLVAALTETELSDWARDEVSETLDDLELNINPQSLQSITFRRNQRPRNRRNARGVAARIARTEDFDDDYTHVCGKSADPRAAPPPSTLLTNIDNIEFMDTGGEEDESSTEDSKHQAIKNSGYVQFVNSPDDEDELATPMAEALPPFSDLESFKEDEESSRLTEDCATTSTSDVTTIVDTPLRQNMVLNTSAKNTDDNEPNTLLSPCIEPTSSATYEDYVKRLQGRISPFSNVRDSIDIRKSRRNNRILEAMSKPREEVIVEDTKTFKSPESAKLEEISRERSKQKDLIHDMVMNKLFAQGKSPQERRTKRNSRGSSSPSQGSITSVQNELRSIESLTAQNDVRSIESLSLPVCTQAVNLNVNVPERPKSIVEKSSTPKFDDSLERRHSIHQTVPAKCYYPSDNDKTPVNDNESFFTPVTSFKPRSMSVHCSFRVQQQLEMERKATKEVRNIMETPKAQHSEAYSLPDLRKALFDSANMLKTPVLPSSKSGLLLDSARASARLKAKMKTDQELGLSPEERIQALKERIRLMSRTESIEALTPEQKTPVVVDQLSTGANSNTKDTATPNRKKSKDRDRRKSIIQAVSDFFHKKSPSSSSPTKSPGSPPTSSGSSNKFSKFRIHRKDKSKSANNSDYEDYCDGKQQQSPPAKSLSESEARRRLIDDPPPVPPPPLNYSPPTKQSEESCSETEDTTHAEDSTRDQKPGRMSKRMARQAHLRRLRMAQEIQRQLEEVEVKQRELETLGVQIEKTIRGETTELSEGAKGEGELTQRWFELMRERNELRRFERELTVRAQDVELEDTHARLQADLRERLAKDDGEKTAEEMAKEAQILQEMLQIVQRRDDLLALLEEERHRYQEEDKDLEAQMLEKGLRLTSITTSK
ncbi:hypothetical protein LSTR_LSTR014575 [Laodelphax striatellus]|uniref:F-actin monooxygenase n=1 Tax=Laodelphax striatellus TaxID=195883 RepID=A0A482WT20_LAOST|nr:hypothetical protein LSTR_LSTR014575 [Laodelphax striatellus]